jgi:hydroxymethylpyrimidine pyrophosphatase-like HAD family hydrolase
LGFNDFLEPHNLTRKRNYDLVICDIDGCLAPESSAPMDVETLLQIAHYNRTATLQGDRPQVTLCSGRPLPFVEALCRLLQNDSVPCIAENGVWLYHPSNNRYLMDPAITPAHLEAVQTASLQLAKKYAHHGVTQQPGKSASVTLYHPDPAYLRAIEPDVRRLLGDLGLPFRVLMSWLYINCDLAHVTKATGIRRLVEAVGIPQERLAGIGDTSGDLAIADNVALFACPGNASSEIQSRADYVARQNEAAGVLEILDELTRD